MKNDGTLDALKSEMIDNYVNTKNEPIIVEIPNIEGAETIKFAVTGNLPPMDFIATDGTPAGYNVAVLAEISKRMNVNIEPVQVDSSARAMALQTGKVDVVFWISKILKKEVQKLVKI